MRHWWRKVRGAIGTGVTWALIWAPIAVFVGTQLIDPQNKMDEMWIMVGAMPGFIAGVFFAITLAVSARNRKLSELSVAKTGGWGALAGLATGILPFLLGDRGGEPMLPSAMIVIPTLTLLSGVSAALTLALAQRGERHSPNTLESLPGHQSGTTTANEVDSVDKLLELSAPSPIIRQQPPQPLNDSRLSVARVDARMPVSTDPNT